MITTARLRELVELETEVEITLVVRARVVHVSDSHGTCAQLRLVDAPRGYHVNGASRSFWADLDEIVEIQP